MIEPTNYAAQVSDAVAIRILKRTRVNLINDSGLPPDGGGCEGHAPASVAAVVRGPSDISSTRLGGNRSAPIDTDALGGSQAWTRGGCRLCPSVDAASRSPRPASTSALRRIAALGPLTFHCEGGTSRGAGAFIYVTLCLWQTSIAAILNIHRRDAIERAYPSDAFARCAEL